MGRQVALQQSLALLRCPACTSCWQRATGLSSSPSMPPDTAPQQCLYVPTCARADGRSAATVGALHEHEQCMHTAPAAEPTARPTLSDRNTSSTAPSLGRCTNAVTTCLRRTAAGAGAPCRAADMALVANWAICLQGSGGVGGQGRWLRQLARRLSGASHRLLLGTKAPSSVQEGAGNSPGHGARDDQAEHPPSVSWSLQSSVQVADGVGGLCAGAIIRFRRRQLRRRRQRASRCPRREHPTAGSLCSLLHQCQ